MQFISEDTIFNETAFTEFLLMHFSDERSLQILHFFVFLALYCTTVTGNLLVITTVALNHHLHTPMYFFLFNLALLDVGSISVTVPNSMANSLMNMQLISYSGCVAQVFFLPFFAASAFAILTVMAYDRYVAICNPLRYDVIMNHRACFEIASVAWISGLLHAAIHTCSTFVVPFCSNIVDQFFCEIPKLRKLYCSDPDLLEMKLLAFALIVTFGCFIFIIASYVQILMTVLRMPSVQGRQKAFSTCLPHLTVVSMFICTGVIEYLRPVHDSSSILDLVFAVMYSVVPPLMNPLIYSMRNKELTLALWKMLPLKYASKFLFFRLDP